MLAERVIRIDLYIPNERQSPGFPGLFSWLITIDERDRYLNALREIQAIPYNSYAISPEGRAIADIVSEALKTNRLTEPSTLE